MGGLDDMSTWTNIVWRQAAKALLGGTEGCDIPHNTLGINCQEERDMDWVVEMMSKNLVNPSLNLSHFEYLPTFKDLEITPEGREIKKSIPERKISNSMPLRQ